MNNDKNKPEPMELNELKQIVLNLQKDFLTIVKALDTLVDIQKQHSRAMTILAKKDWDVLEALLSADEFLK